MSDTIILSYNLYREHSPEVFWIYIYIYKVTLEVIQSEMNTFLM